MLITLLLLYCLGVSFYLVRKQRIMSRNSELDRIWQSITTNQNPSLEDIKVIAEIAKVRQSEIPWYERSISTIGIIAFFSMIIATSVQTINSAKAEIESSNLRQELKELESQRNSWMKLVKELSDVVILKQTNYDRIEKSEEQILKQRLNQIEMIDKPSSEDDAEKLKLYLALKQYDKASTLIDKSPALADEASSESLLFLAEICFVDGARGRAESLLQKFEPELSKQPIEWQLRYFVIGTALNSDSKLYAKEVSALKRIKLNEAEDWLAIKALELKERAKRRVLSSDYNPSQ